MNIRTRTLDDIKVHLYAKTLLAVRPKITIGQVAIHKPKYEYMQIFFVFAWT